MNAHCVIGIVIAAGLSARGGECNVEVRILSRVSKPVFVYSASVKARAMFREIGVNVKMQFGRPVREADGLCGAPIVVQVQNARLDNASEDALAYALPYNSSGTLVYVFLGRIMRLDDRPSFVVPALAHVMVHEISHVLEQIARHSGEGVMKARWSGQDYWRMERSGLPFAAEDVALIHLGLEKRFSRVAAEGQ